MNYSTAVFLINDDARAIACSYEPAPHNDKPVTTIFKTFDPDIKVGDYVVVPTDTRHHLTVIKVEETDVDVDFDSAARVNWIVGRVDKADYDDIMRKEDAAIAAIKSAEKRKKREELRAALILDQEEIKKLALSQTIDLEE